MWKRFIWNPSNCECECDKSCDFSESYYKNCKCKKRLVDKLPEKCAENIKETRLLETAWAENENKYKCSSLTLCIVLFLILFTINVRIGSYFFYFYWYLENMPLVLSLVPALKRQFNKLNKCEKPNK